MWNPNPFFGGYQQPQQYQQRTEIAQVNGEGGAKAYSLAPNSSILLLDTTAPIVWHKCTDSAGYPTLTPYTITPYQPTPPVDINELAARISKLEDKLNAESHTASNESWKPADPANIPAAYSASQKHDGDARASAAGNADARRA